MALVKCKECGEQVSTEAKSCPKCGAKPPRKTSKLTWFVLGIILLSVYAAKNNPKDSANSQNKSTATVAQNANASKKEPQKVIEPVTIEWEISKSKDEMTGEMSNFANSLTVGPQKPLDFPYQDTEAWLGVGCNEKSEWVYIGFNNPPNLSDTETEDGYNVINTRIKWDGKIENVKLTQKWGAKFIHFENDKNIISKITNASTALLELQWHGQQPSYFEFSLKGAAASVGKIKNLCAKK